MKKLLPILALLALPAAANEAMLNDARSVASAMPPKLLEVLSAEIQKGGPEGAISVCKDVAPKMARDASEKTGWAIRRVSLKNRNPKGVPDAWEKTTLEEFDRRAAAGENLAGIEKSAVVEEGGKKTFRYMKALPTQAACLNCHGDPTKMKPEVKAQLAKLYPADLATGYQEKQIRGAITLRKPM